MRKARRELTDLGFLVVHIERVRCLPQTGPQAIDNDGSIP